jgi:hypothetical protein
VRQAVHSVVVPPAATAPIALAQVLAKPYPRCIIFPVQCDTR